MTTPLLEWCVYWETVGDDERVVDRYETESDATAAAEIAQRRLELDHPGGRLLCGYSVRRLQDGVWAKLDPYAEPRYWGGTEREDSF